METITVKDPITFYQTVGQEVIRIANLHKINLEDISCKLSRKQPIETVESFSKKEMSIIAKIINIEGVDDFLSTSQESYKEIKNNTRKLFAEYKKIYTKLKHLEVLIPPFFNEGEDQLNKIMYFLNLEDENTIEKDAECNLFADFKKPTINISPINALAVIRKAEVEFATVKLPKYDKKGLLDWLNSISPWKTNLYDTNFIKNKLIEELSQYGVHLSFSHALTRGIHGVTKWVNNHPLIAITDREKNIAVFWNTLFHELGHAILHQENTNFDIEKIKNKKEKEANQFVNKYLHNDLDLNSYIYGLIKKGGLIDSSSLANELGIEKIFILYRMNKARVLSQHEDKVEYNKYKLDFS